MRRTQGSIPRVARDSTGALDGGAEPAANHPLPLIGSGYLGGSRRCGSIGTSNSLKVKCERA
jgi:hypothetical protein